MTRRQHKILIRMVEGAALGLVALDLVVYLAVVRPLRSMRMSGEAEYTAARDRLHDVQVRVARLQRFKAAVPDAEGLLDHFLKDHVPSRRQGFSRAARLVRKLTEGSKVRLTGLSYKLNPGTDDPLARLGLDLEVDGSFSDVVRFAHALETSDDFVVLGDFSFQPGENRTMTMRVGANLYLRP